MIKKSIVRKVLVFAVLAVLAACGGVSVSASSGGQVADISLVSKYDGSEEYAVIIATDDDGQPVWTLKTEEYPAAQSSAFADIGIFEDQYFYVERGKVISLDRESGRKNWENSDFGGAPTQYCRIISDNGTIYLSGYLGPDFYAVDKYGNTLGRISRINPDYYWPVALGVRGDEVTIRMEGSPDWQETEIRFNMRDYQISDKPSSPQPGSSSGDSGYSNEDLVRMAADYYEFINGQRPPIVEVDSENGDEVTIHLYEMMSDHTATWDWYYVNRRTLKGSNLLGNEVDLGIVA